MTNKEKEGYYTFLILGLMAPACLSLMALSYVIEKGRIDLIWLNVGQGLFGLAWMSLCLGMASAIRRGNFRNDK